MIELDQQLLKAADEEEVDAVKDLLEKGADPSMKDANGDTPIPWRSWHLRPSPILGLLLYGEVPGWYGFPNPNLKGKDLE